MDRSQGGQAVSDMVDAHVAYCKTISDLNMDLAAANERIKELEEQILKSQKQKEIAAKLIDQIFREGPKNHEAEVLLNQYFWELV
jgi:RNA processing factor Prp31